MLPFLAELAEISDAAISCYPNAGLPNPLSETGFDLGPADMARYLASFAERGLINIAGGCCGNTPEHIAAIAQALDAKPPRRLWPVSSAEDETDPKPLRLSGSQPFTQQPGVFILIGERTNVAGSPKFARLIKEGKFEEAVSVARQQVDNGANVLDICMDEGMIDGVQAMTRFLQLLQVGGHRGRPQVHSRQGHCQLHLAEGGRGKIPSERGQGAQVRRRRGSYGLRRARSGGYL
jgi:5-methyltetrahydrofolate--homocysteine methyltransferase